MIFTNERAQLWRWRRSLRRQKPKADDRARKSRIRSGPDCNPTLLFTSRFYYPDITTYAQMLRVLSEHMEHQDWSVTVFSTQPGYNGVYKGSKIASPTEESGVRVFRRRVPFAASSVGRLLGGLVFAIELVAFAARRRGRFRVVTVSTVPPVLMGLTGVVAAKIGKSALVYHCMDLYPEIAVSSKMLKPGVGARLAARIDSFTANRAEVTVVLSEDMKRTLLARAPYANVVVINNFAVDVAPVSSTEREEAVLVPGPFDILFAGNLGRFQGLPALLDGFALAAGEIDMARLVFMGNGSAKSDLEQQAQRLGVEKQVVFISHQPIAVASKAAADCRLAVISLAPGIVESAYPSKTITYLRAGARLLCITETNSELAQLVRDLDLGTTAEPGDSERIADAIIDESNRPYDAEAAERAKSAARDLFSADSVLPRWSALFETIVVSKEGKSV